MKVIDISHWQPDDIIDQCHDKIDGVMIRVGHGTTVDKKFTTHYTQAVKYDLEIGFYWYYDSKTEYGLKKETETFLSLITGLKCTLPVALDMEEQGVVNNISGIAIDCAKVLESDGYFVVVYSNKAYLKDVWKPSVKEKLAFWVADWLEDARRINMGAYDCNTVMVQYSTKGKDVITSNLDVNEANSNLCTWVSNARKKIINKYYDVNALTEMIMNQPEGVSKVYEITRKGNFINIKEGD